MTIIRRKFLNFILLFTVVSLLMACEEDPHQRELEQATYALCSSTWYDSYINKNGLNCEQYLTFYNNGTGTDRTIIYYNNGMRDERKSDFYWDWNDHYFSSFAISYSDGTDYYEHINIGSGLFNCMLNGVQVTFRATDYY